MTWTKLSDDHFDQDPIFNLSRDARLLDMEAKVWCNRVLTDGHLPAAMLARITDSPDREGAAAELVAAGVWKIHPAGGWQLDWSHQVSAAQLSSRAAAKAAKQQAYRERKASHDRGDHSKCDPRYCPALLGVTGNVTGAFLLPEPEPEPEPEPGPKGQGSGLRELAAPAEIPAPHEVEASPGQDVPNEPVPDNEVSGPYREPGGDCGHISGGLDRRADGSLVCPTCRKEEHAKAKDALDKLRAAKQVEDGRERRGASEFRLNNQTEEERAEAADLQLHREEQDNEEISARHLAPVSVSEQNGQVAP